MAKLQDIEKRRDELLLELLDSLQTLYGEKKHALLAASTIDGCNNRHYWLLHGEKVAPGSMEGNCSGHSETWGEKLAS